MHELQGRIPLVGDNRTVVSGRTYNRLAKVLREIYSESIDVGVGPTGGLRLETRMIPSGGGGTVGGGDYSGPFAVSAVSSGLSIAAGRIIAGTSTIAVSGTTVSGSGTVYLSLVYNQSTQSYSHAVAVGTPPAQTDTMAVFRLAEVSRNNVTQCHYGDIYVAGRVV